MPSIEIRYTDKFPEPHFSSLQKLIFADIEQVSAELGSVLASERTDVDFPARGTVSIYRLGAYDGDQLVGWTYGWMEHDNSLYMANSGVMPAHRRKGVYTSLLQAVQRHASTQGAWCIRSRHSVVNNPVIIAKLRVGFRISGLVQSAQMGTLVELTRHLSEQREAMFQKRVLPYVVPDR
ncbi:GNAT family N-acetyltransferase [Pseudoduganella sp. SL102]|uniref:GNAT family N-acetyltransferase n=1 Tax=Pseudoduganella sp. SL102 TaxID=2995154 RepID=UPI00248BF1C1|nr:GNAT family N-acetyltransferase [Pseudoduganella sp. SL102]WBS05569.1 GNAT family N-acetyltransferase [Pseudoduganella sp. SL102]